MQHEERQAENRRARVDTFRAIIERGPTMVFQPIVELATDRVVGVEALARFGLGVPPDHSIEEATSLGLGTELELAAVKAALAQIDRLPPEQFMAVNVSPNVVLDRLFRDLLCKQGQGRVIVEITEHQPVDSYDDLNTIRSTFRRDGIRIAIDDAGAGYASLHHILKLAPDIIKLDIGLTRGIDQDRIKRALAVSLVRFAEESNATVTAEGIETAGELETLRELSVVCGQGFHLGSPAPLDDESTRLSRVG